MEAGFDFVVPEAEDARGEVDHGYDDDLDYGQVAPLTPAEVAGALVRMGLGHMVAIYDEA